jgi:uncharacterized RDD family membrane protein YckC
LAIEKEMTCGYCGTHLNDSEHRCGLCGRRPGDTLTPTVEGALAAYAVPDATATAVEEPPAPRLPRPVQGRLFSDGNVIPFPAGSARGKSSGGGKGPGKPRGAQAAAAGDQGLLDFLPAVEATAPVLDTTVEAKICCDAPVAARLHRAIAAGLDWSMVLIGYGCFLLLYKLLGGGFILTRAAVGGFAGGLALLAFAYGVIWTIAGTETAGMRWTGLRLLTFDGFPPESRQRRYRFLGGCLTMATGVGLLWSFGDEESLTWADHISGTFPTAVDAGSEVLQRR